MHAIHDPIGADDIALYDPGIMGFQIRKSIRVGPFRFNLSNSGIGVSTGIRGLRVGTGPRGTYVHMGRGGLYYRQTLANFASPRTPLRTPQSVVVPSHTGTHGPMYSIGSGDVSQMVDSNFAELLEEIETKRRLIAFWPIMLSATILIGAGLFIFQVPIWIQVTALLSLSAGTLAISQVDQMRKIVVLMYDLEDTGLDNYQTLHSAIEEIANCDRAWHITAQGNVYDPKYHAGASGLIDRREFCVNYRNPPWVRSNLVVPCLSFKNLALYLLPDLILAHSPNGYGAIDYGGLTIDFRVSRFIEAQVVPRDAVIVDYTWQFVNKGGGPDRRFNNNRQLPICQYEELKISNSSGLQELLQFSRCGVSIRLRAAVTEVASGVRRAIAQAEMMEQKRDEERRLLESKVAIGLEDKRPKNPSPSPRSMHSVLFDLLCCMMAADGQVSPTEISKINELMRKLWPGWTEDLCRSKVKSFVDDVRARGYASVVQHAMADLPTIRRQGRERTLMRCMEAIANADGTRSERENKLLDRIRRSLGDPIA